MIPAAQAAPPVATHAHRLAHANAQTNQAALQAAQPQLSPVPHHIPDGLEWLLARDGALTARISGQWWSACSVPHATAARLLAGLELADTTGLFLFPDHPAQVRFALDRLPPTRALILLLPDAVTLALFLHGADFSADIAAGRLRVVMGEAWPDQLRALLRDSPGLPVPLQLVRTPLFPQERWGGVIPVAERLFAEESRRRAELMESFASTARPARPARRMGVVAPSGFLLWEDAPAVLEEIVAQAASARSLQVERLDPDRPLSASRLALAQLASRCDILFVANAGRQELGCPLPRELPIVSWLTTPRIAPFASAGPRDRLLLADPAWIDRAIAAGWPRNRLSPAAWPSVRLPGLPSSPPHLALIADTCPIRIDAERFELSSHRLLWETALREMDDDPSRLADLSAYTCQRLDRLGIAPETLDVHRFHSRLLIPAWRQSVARRIVAAGRSIRLHGAGWRDIPDLAPHAAGPITTRAELLAAASNASALVDPCPWIAAHPIRALPRPLLNPHTLAPQRAQALPSLGPALLQFAGSD